jgi:ADP-ribose pyrophosphatase
MTSESDFASDSAGDPAGASAAVLSSRTIYTGRIISVHLDRVKLPHGATVNMELVRHPGSVVMIPMPGPGEVILVRQYRYAVGRALWELPAGSLDPGEDPLTGAARECHEEIGLVPGRIEQVGFFYPTPGFCTESMTFLRCLDLAKPSVAAHQDEDESVEPRTFTLDQVRAMVRSGEIVDMKTALGVTLV